MGKRYVEEVQAGALGSASLQYQQCLPQGQSGSVFPLDSAGSHSPSQSKSANTTSHTWSESSTLATVLATCCMVTERGKIDADLDRQRDLQFAFSERVG